MKELISEALARFTEREIADRPKILNGNKKLEKITNGKYLIRGLALAPGKTSGHNVCPFMGDCFASCIGYWNGSQGMNGIRAVEIARTRYAVQFPDMFRAQLDRELGLMLALAKRTKRLPLVRLNMFSDLDWSDVVSAYPTIQFYDYTKHTDRIRDWLRDGMPENYTVTLSHSEKLHWRTASAWLNRGHNVAICFDTIYNGRTKNYGQLPSRHYYAGQWRTVVDGDKHDVRLPEFDGVGNVVGVRFKSNGSKFANTRHVNSRFVVSTSGKRFEWATV
jgi:hypothetical protein